MVEGQNVGQLVIQVNAIAPLVTLTDPLRKRLENDPSVQKMAATRLIALANPSISPKLRFICIQRIANELTPFVRRRPYQFANRLQSAKRASQDRQLLTKYTKTYQYVDRLRLKKGLREPNVAFRQEAREPFCKINAQKIIATFPYQSAD